jgi:hypothetical protein
MSDTWTEEGEDCVGWLEVPLALHLASADGTLDERWTSRPSFASPFDSVDLGAGFPVEALGGSLDVAALAPDATQLTFAGRVEADGSVGKVELSTPLVGAPDGQEDARTVVVTWDTRAE